MSPLIVFNLNITKLSLVLREWQTRVCQGLVYSVPTFLPLLMVFSEELCCHLFPCMVQLLLLVWGEEPLVDSVPTSPHGVQ
jgi:hypothetical protein